MATCGLCGKTGQGNVRGHIIPAWAYELTSAFDKEFIFGSKEEGFGSPRNLTALSRSGFRLRENMFCGKSGNGCDQHIGDGESEIKNVFIDSFPNTANITRGAFPHQIIYPKKFNLLTRGIAGILLKCYLSKPFILTKHFTKDNFSIIELLKSAVLDDELSSKIIKFSVVKYYANILAGEERTGSWEYRPQTAFHLNMQPLPNEKMFILIFGGIALIILIDETSKLAQNEIDVFAEHIKNAYSDNASPDFVSLATDRYISKYIPTLHEALSSKGTWLPNMYTDINYFNELSNPASHNLLTENWGRVNSEYEECFCGNLASGTTKKRRTQECCGRFWKFY